MSIWEAESGPHNPFAPGGKMSFTYASVTSVKTVYIVEGDGNFPVDMLRYDRAFCMTPIPHPNDPWYGRKYRVVVGFEGKYKPTVARWESFGWRVLSQTGPVPGVLANRVLSWRGHCHRCDKDARAYAFSVFDNRLLCSDCEALERQHPDFELARNTLRYHLKRGDLGFTGIGFRSERPAV